MVRVAAVLVLLFLSSPASAQTHPEIGRVEIAVEVLYYDVEGADASELSASLSERSPSIGAQRFYGLTEWEVNAEYRWVEHATGCTLEDVRIRLVIQTHLPRRPSRGGIDAQTRRDWDRFVRDLGAHESHHRDLIAAAGDAMRWKLVSLREAECRTMERAAQLALAASIEETKARNDDFDRQTQHGRTQGVIWPPEALGTR